MKIPYIKLYTADLLALSRYVTSEQVGDAILGICELAFENDTAYQPETTREKNLFETLNHWKEESSQGIEQKKKAGRMGAKKKWQKQKSSDVSTAIPPAIAPLPKHTDTDTDTETKTDTDTETEIKNTAQGETAQGVCSFQAGQPRNLLEHFGSEVSAQFEPTMTPVQQGIWFKRNARCLRDIFNFCGRDITLALQTIKACAVRLKTLGLNGGYEAVCRNLPEYMAQAKTQLEETYDSATGNTVR